MCDLASSETKAKGGGINLFITCKKSGKPITVTNEFGMFCEDMCDLKECKKYVKWMNNYIDKTVKQWHREDKQAAKRKAK